MSGIALRWPSDMWSKGLKPGEAFDAEKSAPALHELIASDKLPTTGVALVPGCGRGYDVLALSTPERKAVGVVSMTTMQLFTR